MVLLLTDEDVKKILTMEDTVVAIEDVFRERGLGRTFEIPRTRIYAPPMERDHVDFFMNVKAAAVPKLKVAALRLSTGMHSGPRKANQFFSKKTDRTLLYSTETGEMVAVVHNNYLDKLRVGASTGVATKYIARKDAKTVGVFGSGRQARSNLMAIATVRRIASVKVYSPTKEHCDEYCKEMTDLLDVEARPATPREVVEGSDIILAASNSRVPVFDGGWLKPGAHVNGVAGTDRVIAAHELDAATYIRADVIAVNAKEQIYLDDQRTFLDLIESRQIVPSKIYELGDIVAGNQKGRTTDDEVTLYDNNVGMGIQFAACGAFVLNKARELGIGKELPEAHFNEYRDGSADIGLSHIATNVSS